MSLDPRSVGRSRLPKRNRAAYQNELAIIEEEKGLNDDLIKSLRTELFTRRIRANDATVDVENATTRRLEAELRIRAAKAVKNTLIKARDGLNSSFSVDEPLFDDIRGMGMDDPAPHLQGIADILTQRVQSEEFIEVQIEKASLGVLLAHDALKKCIEEEEVAMAREERCIGVIENIERCISGIEDTIKSLTRSIWRLPESIWCQIFVEAVDDVAVWKNAEEFPPSGSISYPSLTLSAVCHSWRTIAQGYPVLWRTVHLTIDPFAHSDAMRIGHYMNLSKKQALRIIIDAPPAASADQVQYIADLLSGVRDIACLVVRGAAAGKRVVEHLFHRIKSPTALTMAFSDDRRFQKFPTCSPIATNLETLSVKNCSPISILNPSPSQPCKIISLRVFNTTPWSIDWSSFYKRLLPLTSTVRELVLVTKFSKKYLHGHGISPRVLSQLTSIATDLDVLLLFYKFRLFTPALRSLTITGNVQAPDIENWCAYASDQHGGANIIYVDVGVDVCPATEFGVTWDSIASWLHVLPKLSTLSLQAQQVEPILKAFDKIWSPITEIGTRQPSALKVLSITDYDDDGQVILSFARSYQRNPPIHPSSNSTSTETGGVLKVELRNCPNISAEVLAELAELGSIPA